MIVCASAGAVELYFFFNIQYKNIYVYECISYALHYVLLDNLGFLMGYEPFDI